MKVLYQPFFLLCLALFLISQLLEKNGIFIPYFHAYSDDVCAMPVLLSFASALMSLVYFGKDALRFSYPLSRFQIISTLIYTTILFEIILPKYNAIYTADKYDFLAYAAGAILYYMFINIRLTESKPKQM